MQLLMEFQAFEFSKFRFLASLLYILAMRILKEILRYMLLVPLVILELLVNAIIAPIWIAHDKFAHWRAVRLGRKHILDDIRNRE